MILLIGASGYIGQRFAQEIQRRRLAFMPVSRQQVDHSSLKDLWSFIERNKPALIINAAGYIGRPNVDACEQNKAETIEGNLLFPQRLSHICTLLDIPLGHVSSGCIYANHKLENGVVVGYSETDEPNFSFDSPPCSFYSGVKALAEQTLAKDGLYLWRIRAPFDEMDCDRNYLSKLQRYKKVFDCVNSLSHRGDFVEACLDLWEKRAPFGRYNISNPGHVRNRDLIGLMKRSLGIERDFEFFADEAEFYSEAIAPRSSCVLDGAKLAAAGVRMRPVEHALEHALQFWRPEGSHRFGR